MIYGITHSSAWNGGVFALCIQSYPARHGLHPPALSAFLAYTLPDICTPYDCNDEFTIFGGHKECDGPCDAHECCTKGKRELHC